MFLLQFELGPAAGQKAEAVHIALQRQIVKCGDTI